MTKKFNGCAFNYHGSKIRHIDIIHQLLPKENNLKVLDVFCGAASLSTNLPDSWEVTANDLESRLIEIHRMFNSSSGYHSPDKQLEKVVEFNKAYIKGREDKEGYEKAVLTYNDFSSKTDQLSSLLKSCILYTLLCSSFSNQLRWNKEGEWNLPFGKRYCNPNMQKNLLHYLSQLGKKKIDFTSKDFREFNFKDYDVVISDSPYYNTCASYQEGGKWSFTDAINLMSKLDKYSKSGGRFIMFEELYSKGKPNTPLIEWATKYNIKQLGSSSDKSNYQRKSGRTQEVIIFNY